MLLVEPDAKIEGVAFAVAVSVDSLPDEDVASLNGEGGYTSLPSTSQEYIPGKKQSSPHLNVGMPSRTGHKKSPS